MQHWNDWRSAQKQINAYKTMYSTLILTVKSPDWKQTAKETLQIKSIGTRCGMHFILKKTFNIIQAMMKLNLYAHITGIYETD